MWKQQVLVENRIGAGGHRGILAITSKTCSPSAPNLPTFRESGVPELKDYDSSIYYGFMAPAATPKEVLAKIERDIRAVMLLPDVVQRIASGAMEVSFASSAEMGALMRADAEKVKAIVDYAGIKPE